VGSAARGVLNHISFVLGGKKIGVAVLVLPSTVRKGMKTMRRGCYPSPPAQEVYVVASEGVLLMYNGADDKNIYSTGWVLFDKNDPTRFSRVREEPIFSPGPECERVGQVANVVFVEGLVCDGGRWFFYYGGADKNVGVATAPAG